MFDKSNEVPPSAVLYRRVCAFGLPLVSNRASGALFRLLVALLLGARQEPEIPVPPSCRSMPFLKQQGPCASLSSPCRHASSSACLRACEHCALQLYGGFAALQERWGSAPYPGRNLRFLHLPLAAPCRSLSSRGLAFRFPLLAALPARPHACGHANIARYSLQRLRRPVRTMGLRPIPWQ